MGHFRVAGSYGPQDVELYRLKPYNPPHTHKQPPLHFFSDKETLVDDDKFNIGKVLKHQKFANKGKDKHRRPHILKWYVKYKGYDKPEWHDASEFLHDINKDWLQYNIKHKIDVAVLAHVYMGQLSPWHTHPHLYSTVHGAWVRHKLTQHHGFDAELQCCVRACPVVWFLKAWRFSGN